MSNTTSIPDIFRKLVTEVSTIVGYTVNYKFGTWKVINDELSKQQNNKYPLIAILRGWRESREDETILTIDGMRILIAVRSEETEREQSRNDNNYIPYVFEIYDALCQVIADSFYFIGYNLNFKHTVRDWPNLGLENGERLLEDCTDGRVMDDISLKVNLLTCAYPKPICSFTPCPNGRVLDEISMFNKIGIVGLNTANLVVTLIEHTYQSLNPIPFIPTIDPGDGSPFGNIDNLVYTINVANHQDGFYIATITFEGAQVQFFYKVASKQVIHHTSIINQYLTPTYDCQEYYDTAKHSVEIGIDYEMLKIEAEPNRLNGYSLTLFGQPPFNQPFQATSYFSTLLTRQANYDDGTLAIQDVSYSGQSPLRNITYLKTKCQ